MDINNTSILNTLTGTISRGRAPASGTSHSHQTESTNAIRPVNSNADVVTISKAAHALNDEEVKAVDPVKPVGEEENNSTTTNKAENKNNAPATQLTEEDLKQVQELKKRDQEVRTHEAAHLAAAGKYATGGPSYEYKRGPDGKNYAVGGEVGIDTSPVPGDPQATLQKAQQISAAAQAPANPSSQDRQVAASAAQMAAKARQEIAEQTLNGESANTSEASVNGSDKDATAKGTDNNSDSKTNAEASTEANAKAASAYEAVEGISKPQNNATSLIELVA